jgi:hypothetical protein
MAIGDAVAVFLGTATTNRQPSSGVEEQISSIAKDGSTDKPLLYDGSNTLDLFAANVRTHLVQGDASAYRNTPFNMAILITNALYARKDGTTDRIYFGGVQTNA